MESGKNDQIPEQEYISNLEDIATLSLKFFDQVLPQAGGLVLDIGVANNLGVALSKHARLATHAGGE